VRRVRPAPGVPPRQAAARRGRAKLITRRPDVTPDPPGQKNPDPEAGLWPNLIAEIMGDPRRFRRAMVVLVLVLTFALVVLEAILHVPGITDMLTGALHRGK
jgi:hypothetical protein